MKRERSATSKKTNSAKALSVPECETDCSTMDSFGMICVLSPEQGLEAMLTRLLADFHVNRSLMLAKDLASRMNAISSTMSSESLMRLEPSCSCLRTSPDCSHPMMWMTRQATLFCELQHQMFCDSWPRAGFMVDGHVWEHRTLAIRTVGLDGSALDGAWSTPSSQPPTYEGEYVDVNGNPAQPGDKCYDPETNRKMQTDLDLQTRQWNTPTSMLASVRNEKGMPNTLSGDVGNWATPTKSDVTGSGKHGEGGLNLSPQIEADKNNWPTPRHSENIQDEATIQRVADSHSGSGWPAGVEEGRGATLSTAVEANSRKAWTTPQQDDANNATSPSGVQKSLTREVISQPWSTSTVTDTMSTDGTMRPSHEATGRTTDYLVRQVAQNESLSAYPWGTPREADHKGCGPKGSDAQIYRVDKGYLDAQVEEIEDSGRKMHRLNPDWDELLMGWPRGWSNPDEPCDGIFLPPPAGQGPYQFDFEPPRTIHRDNCPNRTKRVSAIGNGVVPRCAKEAIVLLFTAK